MKILMILTSHKQLGDTGEQTGFWLEEFAAPFYVFHDSGADVVMATPEGGMPPMDPRSMDESAQTDATRRFRQDDLSRIMLAHTYPLSSIRAEDFDALFFPGGHGPLWDLRTDATSIALIEAFWSQGKPVGAVCHGPAALLNAKTAEGEPLVKGRNVSAFTNSEESQVGLTEVVPVSLEDEMTRLGANYQKGADFEPFAVVDGLLVTGQNPASSADVACKMIDLLKA